VPFAVQDPALLVQIRDELQLRLEPRAPGTENCAVADNAQHLNFSEELISD
jgi:hypothetical protein